MCEFCRKITQRAVTLREGYNLPVGQRGEAFIDFFNDLIVHIDFGADGDTEASFAIKYCPWCGSKLEVVK